MFTCDMCGTQAGGRIRISIVHQDADETGESSAFKASEHTILKRVVDVCRTCHQDCERRIHEVVASAIRPAAT